MLYALFAAVSSVTPTATPIPSVFPDMWNFAEVNFVDILSLLFTLGLGVAAFLVSRSANRITKIGNKISIIDKAFEIYNFFAKEIRVDDFFNIFDPICKEASLKRIEEISYLSRMLFSESTQKAIDKEILRICDVLFLGFSTLIDKVDNADGTQTQHIEIGMQQELLKNLVSSIKENIDKVFTKYQLHL